jgi:hypothetical protein
MTTFKHVFFCLLTLASITASAVEIYVLDNFNRQDNPSTHPLQKYHGMFVVDIVRYNNPNLKIHQHHTQDIDQIHGLISSLPSNGRRVLNISLASYPALLNCPEHLQRAINRAVNTGSVIVVAAGNDGLNANLVSPANCKNVLVVGASSPDGMPTSYTNTGSNVTVYTTPEFHGTSFAAPVITAVVAKWLIDEPELTIQNIESRLHSLSGMNKVYNPI